MKKNKKKRKIGIIIPICILLFGISIMMLIISSFIDRSNLSDKFVGKWTTDGVTIYEFKKDNTGTLILPLSNYKFSYKVEKDKLFIDFENEKSIDSKYTYSFDNGKLVLKGSNGKFVFKRRDD